MDKLKMELVIIALKKHLKNWKDVSVYIRNYKKYDDLTLRDIDDVLFIVKQELKFNA